MHVYVDRFYTPTPPEREFRDCDCARIETKASIHHPLWVVVVYRIGLPKEPQVRAGRQGGDAYHDDCHYYELIMIIITTTTLSLLQLLLLLLQLLLVVYIYI